MSTGIAYVDLARSHAELKPQLLEAVGRVIDGGRFILGDEVAAFEQKFADYCGVRHAIGVNSGTDALILALDAAGVGAGDEVITVPNSYVATTTAIIRVGAKPVFVDVGEDYQIDVGLVERAVTAKSKAIVPVHLTGCPYDAVTLNRLASAHGLAVIEDAAQAIGSAVGERRVGGLGLAAAFSLHPLKTLNACGDGGIVTTDDDELAARISCLRNIGHESRAKVVAWGYNSRLDAIQAAMLAVKMDYLDAWLDRRLAIAERYRVLLADQSELVLPIAHGGRTSSYHTFVVRAKKRDALQEFLRAKGIRTSVHYPVPIHLQPAAVGLGYGVGDFPVTERQAGEIMSLPVHPELSDDDINRVAASIREFYE